MSQRGKQPPTTWDALERGRASSFGSLDSITEDDAQQQAGQGLSQSLASRVPQGTELAHGYDENGRRRRRSSIAMRFNSIRQMGGPNSIDNFVNSFQRAAAFHDITPARRGSVTRSSGTGDEEAGQTQERTQAEQSRRPQIKSLLSEQMLGAPPQAPHRESSDTAVRPEVSETTSLLPQTSNQPSLSVRSRFGPDGPNIGMSYGSISSKLSTTARRRASILIQEQIEASRRAIEMPDEYKDDIVEREVEVETRPDGEVIERIVGESTVPMTVFNSINILIGVGILALPLAIRYAGWILGLTSLLLAAFVTAYTATLLAKCLDTNSASTTYGDIAYLALGSWGRGMIEFLFVMELTAANVALIILFADSLNSLIPSVSVLSWKVILSIGLVPLNFVPFKTLSVTSVLGICCVIGVIVLVLTDGIIKPHTPGSIREVAKTYAFPNNIKTIPLSLGLFMAPWGGHSVFPAIYKDMRHPKKYGMAVKTSYGFVLILNFTMAIVGYLMFGEAVRDEVTSNILSSRYYPHIISIIIVVFIAIIPITKIPLATRPVMDTINKKFYIDLRQMDAKARAYSQRALSHRLGRGSIAVAANLFQLAVSIVFPDFDSIMALMGSALCFTICVILPCTFYLKIFWGSDEVKLPEKILCFFLIGICSALGLLGTVFACLPKETIGIESCEGNVKCILQV